MQHRSGGGREEGAQALVFLRETGCSLRDRIGFLVEISGGAGCGFLGEADLRRSCQVQGRHRSGEDDAADRGSDPQCHSKIRSG